MTSTPSLIEFESNRRAVTHKATWLLAAVALNALEFAVPRLPFFPWLKPGIANVITVLWIVKYGFTEAMLYTALRIFLSGFYFGFSLFTFSLSWAGGLLSTTAMAILWTMLGKQKLVGAMGLAVIGALFHNVGQLTVVYFMMSNNAGVLGQFPFMLAASVVFGSIVGMLVPIATKIFDFDCAVSTDSSVKTNAKNIDIHTNQTVANFNKIIVALTFAASISLMVINNTDILIGAVVIFSLTSLILNPKKPSVLLYPLKFFMLFVFIAFTHLMFSYGTRISAAPFITTEGLTAFIKQSMRLWCWLQTAHIFKKFEFHLIFISILYKFFPNQKETLEAGMIALEHFPEIVRFAKSKKKISIAALLFKPKTFLTEYVNDVRRRIEEVVEN